MTERDQLAVTSRVFLILGVAIGVLATVYWFISYEHAGTTMLALAGCLALFVGVWLAIQDRDARRSRAAASAAAAAPSAPVSRPVTHATTKPYLPIASLWPLAIGLGVALSLNGLILGWAYATPGVALLGLSVIGFVAQGRRRD